jgi:hypothetical protein
MHFAQFSNKFCCKNRGEKTLKTIFKIEEISENVGLKTFEEFVKNLIFRAFNKI